MFDSHLSRVVTVNFVSALIISFVGCYFLKTVNLTDVMDIANIFGLFFLVTFGIDILVESGDIENNRQRFILAIALILAFDLAFLIMVPLLFGDVFSATDTMAFAVGGTRLSFSFNVYVYMAIFAVLMMVFNYLLYLKDRERYG